MTVSKLKKRNSSICVCPECNSDLVCLPGGQIRVVAGKVDYDNIKPKFVCTKCGKFYRELLNTAYFDVFKATEEDISLAKKQNDDNNKGNQRKQVKKTGDIAPARLNRDVNNQAECPRCGAKMKYLEPEAAKIVNGRADFSDTVARFRCDECDSLYRQIASTDYYQWSEK